MTGVHFEEDAGMATSSSSRDIERNGESSKSLSSLNSQLMTHGWAKKPLNLDALGSKDHANVVGVIYELLGSAVANLSLVDDLSARHRTLTYEHERLSKRQTSLMQTNHRLEAQMTGWKATCEDIEKRLKAEQELNKELREEIGRSRKAVEAVRIAAGHEAKKSQIKLDKAQAHLARLANDAFLATRPQGLVLLNPITGGRSQPVAPPQSILVEQSVKDLAEIRESLQEEAEAFRHVTVSVGNALQEALATASGKDIPERILHSQFFSLPTETKSRNQISQTASSTTHASIADTRLKAMINDLRERMLLGAPQSAGTAMSGNGEDGFDADPETQKKEWRERENLRPELEDRVKDLEVEIICARAREDEAHKVVEELTRVQAQTESRRSSGSSEEGELSRLSEEREALEAERKMFAEATMRLSQEQKQFESERNAFIEERRQADLEAMRGYLPTSPLESTTPQKAPSHQAFSDLYSVQAPESPWNAYRPTIASPLAASKPRTPKVHSAGKRKVKTPLSRLVFEKGLKAKGRASLGPADAAQPLSEANSRIANTISAAGKGTNDRTIKGKKEGQRSSSPSKGTTVATSKRVTSSGRSSSSSSSTTSSRSKTSGPKARTVSGGATSRSNEVMKPKGVWR